MAFFAWLFSFFFLLHIVHGFVVLHTLMHAFLVSLFNS
jgi:hypothetical protein